MKRLITLYLDDTEDIKDKVSKALEEMRKGDEMLVLSKVDVSRFFKGYYVEKKRDEEGMWLIRVKMN